MSSPGNITDGNGRRNGVSKKENSSRRRREGLHSVKYTREKLLEEKKKRRGLYGPRFSQGFLWKIRPPAKLFSPLLPSLTRERHFQRNTVLTRAFESVLVRYFFRLANTNTKLYLYSLDEPEVLAGDLPEVLEGARAAAELVVGVVLRQHDPAGAVHALALRGADPLQLAVRAAAVAGQHLAPEHLGVLALVLGVCKKDVIFSKICMYSRILQTDNPVIIERMNQFMYSFCKGVFFKDCI